MKQLFFGLIYVLIFQGHAIAENATGDVTLANESLSISFAQKTGFSMAAFSDLKHQRAWVRKEAVPVPLWEIVVGDHMLNDKRISATNKCETASKLEGGTLSLTFKNIAIGEEQNALEVVCSISLEKSRTLWKIAVKNKSKSHAVWEVRYPRFAFTPSDDKAKDDFLAVPIFNGMVFPNPMEIGVGTTGDNPIFFPGGSRHYCDNFGRSEPALVYGLYPYCTQSMQFWAYYGIGGGLYCATEDGKAMPKDFKITRDKTQKRFLAEIIHFPEEMMEVRDYTAPYAAVLEPFQGDWFDACQMYRRWALNQFWCRDSRKAKQQPQPLWFRDLGQIIMLASPDHQQTCRHLLEYAAQFKGAQLGFFSKCFKGVFEYSPFPVHEEHDPDNLKKVFALSGTNLFVMPYMNANEWSIRNPEIWTKGYSAAKLTPNGDMTLEVWDSAEKSKQAIDNRPKWVQTPPSGEMYGVICPGCAEYRDYFAQTVIRHVQKFGGKSIYLDQFGGSQSFCFNPRHNHPLGGGEWGIQAKLKLVEQIRAAYPDLVFTCEGISEVLQGQIDAFLTLPPRRWQLWERPLFQTVYNEYSDCFGFGIYPPDLQKDDGIGFRTKFAVQISCGEIPGYMSTARVQDLLLKPAYKRDFEWLKKLVAFRHEHREFFSLGQRLRDPSPIAMVPSEVSWALGKNEKEGFLTQTMLPVVASCWKAPSGVVAVALINPFLNEQNVKFSVDGSELGVPGKKNIAVEERLSAGECKLIILP